MIRPKSLGWTYEAAMINYPRNVYLQMSVLAQAINVIMKVNDGTRMKEADNSSSQCCPVKPNEQMHSNLRGGSWSRHFPLFWQGWKWHSFSLTHSRPDDFKPVGHLGRTIPSDCAIDERECSNNNHVYRNHNMKWNKKRKRNVKFEYLSTYLPSTEYVLLRKQNYFISSRKILGEKFKIRNNFGEYWCKANGWSLLRAIKDLMDH